MIEEENAGKASGEVFREAPPVDKSYFDRLSTDELVRMADYYGVDIPPELDRIFIIEELLDLFEEENEYEADPDGPVIEDADFPDQAPLPKQYNITFMEVLIRDPLWAFVFWELRAAEKESLESSPDFEGYYLKVSSRDGGEKRGGENKVNFTVSVGNNDTAWYIAFPDDDETAEKFRKKSYQVELCARKAGAEFVLAESEVFSMPALLPKKSEFRDETKEKSLISLSGIDDFPIIRNGDRESRIKIRKGKIQG